MGKEMEVTLEIEDTTPYNALIEIANLFNAIIRVNFKKKTIYFLNKEHLRFSGLKLKPSVNLQQFSYKESGSDLYNIMHVSGGQDAYNNYVTIIPDMPNIVRTILIETYEPLKKMPVLNSVNYYNSPIFVNYNDSIYVRKPNYFYEKIDVEN
jgi:hypothetical protein